MVVAPGLLLDLILHAEALAFDDDRVGVVQDAVEDGGGQRTVVVEDLRPVFVGAVSNWYCTCYWSVGLANRAYKHWSQIFNNDSTLTSAILDRVLHHADTVIIEGKSFRMKDEIEE